MANTDSQPDAAGDNKPVSKARSFSKKSKALLLTAAFMATAALPGVAGAPARGVFTAANEAPGMVYTMHKGEEMYLSDARLTDARTNTWTVKGMPISDGDWKTDGILFTVKSSALNYAWARAAGDDNFLPDRVVAPIALTPPGTLAKYKITYYTPASDLAKAAGPQQAELLAVTPLPPDPPKVARSGIPFAWPPGTWDKAFTPF